MTNLVQFKEVDFARGMRPIFSKLNCQVDFGERLALVGPSGCGKTTFLRLTAGLERVKSGQILLRNRPVDDGRLFVPPRERQLGFVFQNFALFERVTVRENIFYGCRTEAHNQEAQRLVALMKLESHLSKTPLQLSGGERQKVALARSLALRPDLLLLDEPFASIDRDQTQTLIDELVRLCTDLKITAIMVTHSPEEADRFATRTLHLG